MQIKHFIIAITISLVAISCSDECKKNGTGTVCFSNNTYYPIKIYIDEDEQELLLIESGDSGCSEIKDGTHKATVKYANGKSHSSFKFTNTLCDTYTKTIN